MLVCRSRFSSSNSSVRNKPKCDTQGAQREGQQALGSLPALLPRLWVGGRALLRRHVHACALARSASLPYTRTRVATVETKSTDRARVTVSTLPRHRNIFCETSIFSQSQNARSYAAISICDSDIGLSCWPDVQHSLGLLTPPPTVQQGRACANASSATTQQRSFAPRIAQSRFTANHPARQGVATL